MNRRHFIANASQSLLAAAVLGASGCNTTPKRDAKNSISPNSQHMFFKLSLAQWSLHRSFFDGNLDHLDFAATSRRLGFEGIEYVNGFFKDKAKDKPYLNEMKLRANNEGQQNVLIMVDGEGGLAHPDKSVRDKAVENHFKWVEAAHFLGCHAIRVNLAGGKDMDEAKKASIESLSMLATLAKASGIAILVENHGGFSSNGAWMSSVFSSLRIDNCGTLPDFGNFCISGHKKDDNGNRTCLESYDRYRGMEELLPFAKAVSAKSYDFDMQGNETTIDFLRMMKMVKAVGYNGFVGVEYEGVRLSEEAGIIATKNLLLQTAQKLS